MSRVTRSKTDNELHIQLAEARAEIERLKQAGDNMALSIEQGWRTSLKEKAAEWRAALGGGEKS